MRLLRSGEAGSAALELAISHALLTRVSKGELPSTLRVYRPRDAVAFGKLDRLSDGYAAAVEAARTHGYEPVLRLPGGHAAAYNAQSIGIDVVWALDDPATGTHDRFANEGERLAAALRGLGVDARVGEVPGEYCPGAFSVNARGRVKLIGTAQRLVKEAALGPQRHVDQPYQRRNLDQRPHNAGKRLARADAERGDGYRNRQLKVVTGRRERKSGGIGIGEF